MNTRNCEKCSVPGCASVQNKTLFACPRNDKYLQNKWIEVLRLEEGDFKRVFVCESHFQTNQIIFGYDGSKQLLTGAIPSVFNVDLSSCRFCLEVLNEFDKISIDQRLKESFEELMDFRLDENENLPDCCCKKCSQEILTSARIKRKVSEVQVNLMKLLELQFPNEFLGSENHPVKVEITTPDFDYEDLSFNPNEQNYNSSSKYDQPEVKDEVSSEFNSFPRLKEETEDSEYFEESVKAKKFRKVKDEEVVKKIVRRKKPREPKQSNERVKCEICSTKVSKCNFTIHVFKKHSGIEHFECDLCGKFKRQKSTLIDHMQTNHMLTESRVRYPCRIPGCNKSYLNQYTLDEHVKHKHLKHVDRICEICGISIPSRFRYNDHMRSKHTLETPYKCSAEGCDYQCSTSAMLREHKIRIHPSGTSVCNICFKTFSTVKKLHNHKRLHKEKNFVCNFENCDKKFRNAHKLKVHKECHLGVKKFQCDYCSAPFQQRNHVYRHITSVHLKPEYKCEIPGCNSKYARKDFLRSHVRSHHANVGEANLNALLQRIKDMKDIEIDQTIYSISKIQ